jgi:hypothetical protein
MNDGMNDELLAEIRATTRDRDRLRSDYAAALIAHFGPRASAIAQKQVARASGAALTEWTELAALIDARLRSPDAAG